MKISDFTISRNSAESIKFAYDNEWNKTFQLHPSEPCEFGVRPRDNDRFNQPIDGYLSLGDFRIEFADIKSMEIGKRDSTHGMFTIKCKGSAPVYIPVEWYEYEPTDLHPVYCEWEGIYKDGHGYLYAVHEYIGSSSWDKEWEDMEQLPDGAVYFEIYEPDTPIEDIQDGSIDYWDGGCEPYDIGETLENILSFWTDNTDIIKVA